MFQYSRVTLGAQQRWWLQEALAGMDSTTLFFGSVDKLEQLMDPKMAAGEIVVLEMPQVINLDTTGLDALEGLLRLLRKRGGRLILADLTEQPLSLLRRSGFLDELGRENLFENLESALAAAHATAAPAMS